ncbi:porin [Ottowia testudinis]|uniref:Porin n=1 Tax=Ottowia testudinis TaxID=2816950 RepID=A0A975H3Q9_9BURK|nr:porin [Ottowia testudinis]QTD45511.1 porin [Ottowia testudinis]
MKKNLIALAALAAGSAVFAQSSVTLYGVADAGVGKLAGSKTGMKANSIVNTSDSYLGLRGTEDLGGGLKAGFNFEQGINLKDGSTDDAPSTPWATKTMFQRAANIWLGGNWGTFKMGRAYTPSYNAMSTWSLMGKANNSVVPMSFGHVGGDAPKRNSSQLSYKTPDFGGFNVEVAYILKADNNDAAKMDLGLTYENGPLSAGVAYNKTKNLKANWALGAKYNFGVFELTAGYYNSRNAPFYEGGQLAASNGRINGFSLGGRVSFDAASVGLEVARDTKVEYYKNAVKVNAKKYTNASLEGRYSFSKRTFAYATYVRYGGENNYGVGLRHNF